MLRKSHHLMLMCNQVMKMQWHADMHTSNASHSMQQSFDRMQRHTDVYAAQGEDAQLCSTSLVS